MKTLFLFLLIACSAAGAEFLNNVIVTDRTMMATSWTNSIIATNLTTGTASRNAIFDSFGRLTNDLAWDGSGAPVRSNSPSLYAPIVNSATASRAAIYDASGRLTNGTIAAADFPALIGDITTIAGALTTTLINSHQIASGTTGGINMPAGTTWFAPLWCTVSNTVTVDVSGSTRSLMPRAGTIRNLYFKSSGALGNAQTNTITVMTNGVATGIVCFIQGTSATSANDTTHTATFSAADEIGIRMVTTSGTTARKFAWAIQID